jgi:outer membrane protein TolC
MQTSQPVRVWKKVHWMLCCLIWLQASAAHGRHSAETTVAESEGSSLEELLQELERRNPELQALQEGYRAALTREPQAGALPDPRLMASWASAGRPWPGAGLGEDPNANLGVQITQELPFPGKRALRRELAGHEARGEAARYRGLRLSLIARLKSAYHELQGIREQLAALDRLESWLRQLSEAAEARYSTGVGGQQELWTVRLETSQVQSRKIPLRKRLDALTAEVASLVDRPAETLRLKPAPHGDLPSLPELAALWGAARRNSPVLDEQRVQVDARRTGVELARRDYYPDFEVMAGYYNMGRMKDMWEAGVRINVPLWFAERQRPALEESAYRLAAAERQVRATELALSARIADLYSQAQSAGEVLDFYHRQLLPEAAFAVEASINAYETGRDDLFAVLSTLRALLEFELAVPQARADYLKALAALEALVGKGLGA